jgi:RND family efflux transporter MFP subunit
MRVLTRALLPLLAGALGGALVLCLGGPTGHPTACPALAGSTVPTPTTAEPMVVPPSVPSHGPSPGDVLEVPGKTQPAPGRRALLAPVPLHPVIEVRAQAGDRVTKGQVLVRLDDDEAQAEVRARQAALESAGVVLKEADRFLGVAEGMAAKGVLPEHTLHAARVAFRKAQQDEKGAKAALESAQAEWEHYTVTAPLDGVITWLDVVPGMVSRPGTTVWGEILDLSEIDVECSCRTEQADRVTVGQAARVQQEGHADRCWAGKVVFVGPAADVRTGLVPVRVRVERAGGRLRCHVEVKVRFATAGTAADEAQAACNVRE